MPTVESIVHLRALARLKAKPSQSNKLKERSAKEQCAKVNGGEPCGCKLPDEEEPRECKLDQAIKPTSCVGTINGLWDRLKAAL